MELKCDVCGSYNGSCNRYQGALGDITICPSCLVFGSGKVVEAARNLHKTGGLIQDEERKSKKNSKRRQ